MDNLSHSLTGALAAKITEVQALSTDDVVKQKRVIFWLFVICANLPDIDVALGFLGDPIFSIKHHRGITHSLLFAPIFALLPAYLASRLSKINNLRVLWLTSFIGILLHIFFDLITPFGTQLLAPFSEARFALDWMFIIDPFFTGFLGLMLLFGKLFSTRRNLFVVLSAVFVVGWLSAEMICHRLAYRRVEKAISEAGVAASKISALPQPLSIFRWKGLAQTNDGVMQAFFSVLDEDSLQFTKYENAHNRFVVKALATKEVQWYMQFARHPWIRSEANGDHHIVELSDLQFSLDTKLVKALGFPERSMPFVLRVIYSPDGELAAMFFEERELISNSSQ